MQTIKVFYLENCPYCRNARRAVEELTAEKEAYAQIPLEWIEESRQPQIAQTYDYYYVPTLFVNGEKLYEASPADSFPAIKASIKNVMDRVIAQG